MTLPKTTVFLATLVACATPVLAQTLPYNPIFLVQGQDSRIYQFNPNENPQFSVYDTTNTLTSADVPEALTSQLPFLEDKDDSFIPVATRNGLTVFSGECAEGEQELNLWAYGFGESNRTWTRMRTTSTDVDLSANYLAAAFAYPSNALPNQDSLYVFGGMCPSGATNASTLQSDAMYSNTMLTISPEQGQDFQVSLTGTRAPPVAEAGLSITPLVPATFSGNVAQQQNFVLIGGHTQRAFINMSQVALFSLPEQSWAFVDIAQPKDNVVEPRSGHTAVVSADGSRIVVLGGWVGDTTNPASPQLVVLEVGQGFGGNASWSWTVPQAEDQYLGSASGVYGHGAVMLPGDVMMVTGGYSITTEPSGRGKRDTLKTMFYNLSSSTWTESYTNPSTTTTTHRSHSGLTSSQKTGIGAGLGVGLAVAAILVIFWFFYVRKRREQRRFREKELRAMALGTQEGLSTIEYSRRSSQQGIFTSFRSASWGARQEQQIESSGQYSGDRSLGNDGQVSSVEDFAEKDNMHHIVAPAASLRSNLRARGPAGFGNHFSSTAPGVFTIEEVEERSDRGSFPRPRSAGSRPHSDPFKDPPLTTQAAQPSVNQHPAEQRRQEVEKWVEDWQSAAESMSMSRSPSKATSYNRTYSNLSALQSSSSSSGKDTSDRTNSNLSDRSNYSTLSAAAQGSAVVSRSISQRSGNPSYALFSSAAAAMARIAGRQDHANMRIERSASKRAVSTGDLAQMAVRKRSNSVEHHNHSILTTPQSREDMNAAGEYFTPPEPPSKDYKIHERKRSNSLTSQSKKAFGALSQGARRILSGTANVNVADKVENIEERGRENSPTKHSRARSGPDILDPHPRQVSSSGTAFWKHRQGAKDWEDSATLGESSGTVRRRSQRPNKFEINEDIQNEDNASEWDIETAVQQRVVQVMFTVPKEKLRVVNADNLSMLSRSNTDASRTSLQSEAVQDVDKAREKELYRMSRVTEDNEASEGSDQGDTTLIGSSLQVDSAFSTTKGKDRVSAQNVRPRKSGETVGKAT